MTCPSCGSPVTPAARFCSQCGMRLPEQFGGDGGGQRRWLTVLFCDVVESTALSRQIDPEEYGECMLAYQNLGRDVVERHGGYVDNFLGDGLVALFGWPAAHERDADLAVRAGRELVSHMVGLNGDLERDHGIRLQVRVGVHSGLAMVGRLGGANRRDTSFGAAANVASRIQTATEPGTVAISSETKRLLRERWVLKSLGHPTLKGVGSDVEVFTVEATGSIPGPDVERVYPLVDREAEFGVLKDLWSDVDNGVGAVLTVEGEGGVGKSRLVYEFLQLVGPSIPWLTVQCSPLTSHVPFAPFLSAPSPPSQGRSRSPEERRADLQRSMLTWVFQLAADGPGVLHIEDAHWADPSTGELIEQIADETGDRPLLVLCTARPSDRQRWASHRKVRTLRLPPLEDADIRKLVHTSSEALLPTSTIEDIVERADGLPLFAEQLAAAMAGAPSGDVPVTLQASLMAQLDQLGPDIRVLLQRAAALGRIFDDELLEELLPDEANVGRSLERIVDAGILTTGERQHKFRHALLQEAAHESMLRSERRAVHGRIASVLQERRRSLVDRQPGLMAYHLQEARDPRAVWWLERAGTQAAGSAAFAEASGYFEGALALVGLDDAATELRLRIKLGNAMFGAVGYGAADTLPVWNRAEELARRLGDIGELTSALNGEAVYWNQAGLCRRSVVVAEEILRVSDLHDLRIGRLRGHCTLALNHLFLGDAQLAREHALHAIELYRPGDFGEVTYGFGTDQGVIAHGVGGAAAWITGHLDEGIELTGAAVELGGTLGSPISELLARVFKGFVHHMRGEHVAALEEGRVLVNEGTRLRLPFPTGFGHILHGAERSVLDGDPAGVAEVLLGMDEMAMTGGQNGAPLAFVLLADAYLSTGELSSAAATATDGVNLADALDQHFFDPELMRIKARALAGMEAPDPESVTLLRRATDHATDRGHFGLALRAACDLGEIAPDCAPELLGPLLDKVVGGSSTLDPRRARDILNRP